MWNNCILKKFYKMEFILKNMDSYNKVWEYAMYY